MSSQDSMREISKAVATGMNGEEEPIFILVATVDDEFCVKYHWTSIDPLTFEEEEMQEVTTAISHLIAEQVFHHFNEPTNDPKKN